MEIKIQSRQTGKSYDIAQILKKDKNAIVLVPAENMKVIFVKNFDVDENQVKVFSSFVKNGSWHNSKIKIYIDEIGCCVQSLFNNQIIYGTHT